LDFLKNIGKLVVSSQFPTAAFALAMLPLAAAEISQYIVHEGRPGGGSDLCSGVIFGCIQGYITNGTEPWTLEWPQFSRVVYNTSGSLDPTASESLQLKDCMSISKVGGLVVDALDEGQSAAKELVSLSSGRTWHQLAVSGQASQIPQDSALPLQNAFAVASQECMDDWARMKYQAIIAGSIVGGIAAIALCVAGCLWCCKQAEKCDQEQRVHPSPV
jgi:hypothetical protein